MATLNKEEILKYLRKHSLMLGEYIIQYNGSKEDTVNGITESWTIIRKIPPFKGVDKE